MQMIEQTTSYTGIRYAPIAIKEPEELGDFVFLSFESVRKKYFNFDEKNPEKNCSLFLNSNRHFEAEREDNKFDVYKKGKKNDNFFIIFITFNLKLFSLNTF